MKFPLAVFASVACLLPAWAADPEEEVAHAIKKMGGKVERQSVRKLGVGIIAVSLQYALGKEAADPVFQLLADCKQLRRLQVNGSKITSEGMNALGRLTQLEELDLRDCLLDKDQLPKLAKLTQLRVLRIGPIMLTLGGDMMRSQEQLDAIYSPTDATLQALIPLFRLERLELDRAILTDRGLSHLRSLTNLRNLSLEAKGVTDDGLKVIGEFRTLTDLTLVCRGVTPNGLPHLNPLTELRRLSIVYPREITADSLKLLAKHHPRLTELSISGEKLTADDFALFAAFPSLEFLHVTVREVGDSALPHLARLKSLRSLVLDGGNDKALTDKGLQTLAEMRDLHRLTVTGGAVSGQGREALRQRMPECITLPTDD